MDGYKRKHESGYDKRKKKQQQDNSLNQISGSLLPFVKFTKRVEVDANDNVNSSIEIENVDINTDENKHNLAVEPIIQDLEDKDAGLQSSMFVPTSNKSVTDVSFSNDPADWIINADLIEYFSRNTPIQNKDCDLSKSARSFGTKVRYARKE